MKVAVYFPSHDEPVEMVPEHLEALAAEEGQAIVQFSVGKYRLLAPGSMRVLQATATTRD